MKITYESHLKTISNPFQEDIIVFIYEDSAYVEENGVLAGPWTFNTCCEEHFMGDPRHVFAVGVETGQIYYLQDLNVHREYKFTGH